MGKNDAVGITIEQFLKDYSRKKKITNLPKPDLFALCSSDIITAGFSRRTNDGESTPFDVFVDGQNDNGIDGLAIIVNGELVCTEQDIDDLIKRDHSLSVKFIFVQATMESKFSHSKMKAFSQGVWEFFHPEDLSPINAKISNAVALKEKLFANLNLMKNGLPEAFLYYASWGQWQGDENLEGALAAGRKLLLDLGYFKECNYEALDSRDVINMHYDFRRHNCAKISQFLLGHAKSPQPQGVLDNFTGAIYVHDLIDIISLRGSKQINKNVFIDNVRGYQGPDNKVNAEIKKTLETDPRLISIYSNGVTIVCRGCIEDGAELELQDYQIVNGCQTSHVIYENKEKFAGEKVTIPAKIVVTQDDLVIENIIRTTNSQTNVAGDQILSLLPFNRRLAEYYRALNLQKAAQRVYYDIHQGEYKNSAHIDDVNIITITEQIQVFAAMFFGVPHMVIERLDEVRADSSNKVFDPKHPLDPYYSAALALVRFRHLDHAGLVDKDLVNFRFQMLYVLRKMLMPKDFSLHNWRGLPVLCNKINQQLYNHDKALELFNQAGAVVRRAAQLAIPDQPAQEHLERALANRKSMTSAIDQVFQMEDVG